MVKNTLNRVKAAVVSMAMVATTLAAPAISSLSVVTAATTEITKLPYTFTADGVKDGKRQGNVALPAGTKAGDTITLNFTTASKVTASIGVYGFGTDSKEDGYWYTIPEADQPKFSSGGKSTFSCEVVIPSAMKGNPTKIGIGVWYPEDDSKWTLESIDSGSTGPTNPGDPTIPVTENNKSGTCSLVDNKNGTATITATLAAQYAELDANGNKQTEFDFLLTQGTDEEDYAPYKDAEGNDLPTYNPGDPINSKKFMFKNFGIDDMANITFESFEYVLTSDDYDMSTLQYGGGINVKKGSPADTESQKGKNGYWYNDQGVEDMENFGSEFELDDIHGAYEASNCGNYAKLCWDVPKGVQPYEDFSNSTAAVGFQYWWGKDDTKTSTDEEGQELNYEVIPEVHLKSATAVYTRTMTVPYNKTVNGPTNITLTAGSDTTNQTKLPLADLELGERDKLSAVEFTFKSAEALQKFVGAYGISVDESKAQEAAGVVDGWYQAGDVAVINCENNTFKVMWILPDAIRNAVYPDGELLIGYWYGDIEGGTTVDDITISDVKYHVYRTQEEQIEIKGEDGLVIPDQIEINVGDTYELKSNVPNSTFESDRPAVATVDENGVITGVSDGLATITVTTPEGQTATITVIVKEAATTTVTTVTTTTTTSQTTVTTVTEDPSTTVDWSRVLYGDVNVDGKVNLTDAVAIARYLANPELNPMVQNKLLTATSLENADCEYDHLVNSLDSTKLTEYNLRSIGLLDLGPDDKSDLPMYKNLK